VSSPPRAAPFEGIDLRDHRLENGVRAFLVPDPTAPVLICQVWYRVGSADEREATADDDHGITGLSHFYEHLMFRGTERFPKFFDAVYQRGGQLNAWTWLDATCYWEKLPAGHLRFALDAEVDRFANMGLGFLDLEAEREVVKSERMMRTDDDPSGSAGELLHRRMFDRHPYGWPTVGWMHDLNRITLEEAEEYHRAHYIPANAFLVVVGDFDADDALRDIEETFGRLPAQAPPERPRRPAEPEPTAPRRDRVEHPVAAPLLQIAWPSPAGADDRFAALEVLHHLLVRGKSGRVQRALVFGDDPVATSVTASLFPMRDPYVYMWEARVRPGRSAANVEARLLDVLADVVAHPPDEDELAKAALGLAADMVRGALTAQGKADAIGFAHLATGDPLAWFKRVTRYATVTTEELVEVAQALLAPNRRITVVVTDPGSPLDAVRAHLGDDPSEAEGLLLEAMKYGRSRHDIAAQERSLDEEDEAIAHLERRRQTALARAEAAGDGDLQAAIEAFATEDTKGPRHRAMTLERTRCANAEARLALEVLGADLRARHADMAESVRPDSSDALAHSAAAAYLGLAAPADLEGATSGALSALLVGHLHDLRGEPRAAQAAYARCRAAEPEGPLGDVAWERSADV